MPNLLPTSPPTAADTSAGEPGFAGSRQAVFGTSWRFDLEAGEFVTTPTGAVAETRDVEAWLEWCRKAAGTSRYRHLAYGADYGQECADLIARQLGREGNEAEIKRMVTECLTVDPRTASVSSFAFEWQGDTVRFTCELTNSRGEIGRLSGKVVVG